MAVEIKIGDCLNVLRSMPAESVDCVVTSPPYWGLRDYGVDGQMGLEPTLAEHLQVMVDVFEEVHRVLKPEGTLWLNYGDCYATAPNGRSAADTKATGNDDRTFRDKPFSTVGPICADGSPSTVTRGNKSPPQTSPPSSKSIMAGGYLKPKDLCMVPNRLAIALQEAGWWVRSEIIWAKPNPMPESVKDRPGGSHEKIWLLSKSQRYFYDAEAVLQPVSKNTHARLSQDVQKQIGSERANGGAKTNGNMKAVARKAGRTTSTLTGGLHGRCETPHKYPQKHKNLQRSDGRPHSMHKARVKDNDSFDSALALTVSERNLRNYEPAPVEVWKICTAAFSEAHFATFPPELAERCIKAGCPKNGVVLDPFGGAGTTGLVADRLQRDAILIELSPEYAEMARKRIQADASLFTEVVAA